MQNFHSQICFIDLRIFHNVLKILWSLHHMMHVDHRRRFAFETSIENADARIWFCCREIVFITYCFDYMQVNFELYLLSYLPINDESLLAF